MQLEPIAKEVKKDPGSGLILVSHMFYRHVHPRGALNYKQRRAKGDYSKLPKMIPYRRPV